MSEDLLGYYREIPRCREQLDQCCYPDGSRCTDAVAVKMPDRLAYECPVCHRTYPADRAFQYSDREWVAAVAPLDFTVMPNCEKPLVRDGKGGICARPLNHRGECVPLLGRFRPIPSPPIDAAASVTHE